MRLGYNYIGSGDYTQGTTYGSEYGGYIGVMAPQPPSYNAANANYGHSAGLETAVPISPGAVNMTYYAPGEYPLGTNSYASGAVTNYQVLPYSPPAPPVYQSPNIEQVTSTGVKPVSYYGSSSYTPYTPQYVQVTPQQVYYQSPTIEQVTSTATAPPPYTPQYVTVTPQQVQNPYGAFTGGYVQVTPAQVNYNQQSSGGSSAGGGGPSGGGSGGSQPQPKPQQQTAQRPVTINVIQGSGSGRSGGNTGALYNPDKQAGNYGTTGSGSSYGGANAGAGYNAPSIVPYLLIGGLGLLAYEMMKKKHH